jgi:hypothetical protein
MNHLNKPFSDSLFPISRLGLVSTSAYKARSYTILLLDKEWLWFTKILSSNIPRYNTQTRFSEIIQAHPPKFKQKLDKSLEIEKTDLIIDQLAFCPMVEWGTKMVNKGCVHISSSLKDLTGEMIKGHFK